MPEKSFIIDESDEQPDVSIERAISRGLTKDVIRAIDDAIKDFVPLEKQFRHEESVAEHRVDFAAIKKTLDDDQVRVDLALRVPIRKVLDDLIELIKRQDKAGGITDSFVMGLTMTTGPEAQKILGDYLLKVWKRGRELAAKELPEKIKSKVRIFHLQGLHDQQDHDPTGGGGINFGDGKTPLTQEKIKTIFPTIKEGKILHIVSRDKFGGTTQVNTITASVVESIAINGKHRLKLKIEGETFKGGSSKTERIPARVGQEVIWDSDDVPRRAITGLKVSSHESDSMEIVELHIYAGLEPVQAINFFQNLRPWLVKGIIDDELKRAARLELTEHLKGGRTLTETIGNLRSAWEPWVGDPTKVVPSGVTGTPEDILQAYRLENIVRTEAIGALNSGRTTVADEAGDFVQFFEYSAILDQRTTEICDAADGIIFRVDDPRAVKLTPPLHYQCRSLLIFITKDDLPVQPSSDAKLDKIVRMIEPGFK